MTRQPFLTRALLASTFFITTTGFAATLVNTPLLDQDFTTGAPGNKGDVTIQASGQLKMTMVAPNNGDAIVVNDSPRLITLAPNNNNAAQAPDAILTTTAGRHGISITNTGKATVNIGQLTAIETSGAAGSAIVTDGPLILNNSGSLLVSNPANTAPALVLKGAAPTQYSITNQALGLIKAPITALALLGENTFSMLNNGAMEGFVANAKVVALGAPFQQFNNSGTIKATISGDGIYINNAMTGTLQNLAGGTIVVGSGNPGDFGNAINIEQGFVNGVTNNSGNLRINTNSATDSSAVRLNAFGIFTNDVSGIIQSIGPSGHALVVDDLSLSNGGSINNNGIIQTSNNTSNLIADSAPVYIKNGFLEFINTGTISNTAMAIPTIVATVGAQGAPVVTNGFTNKGTISNPGDTAINFQFDSGNGIDDINVALNQQSGSITGGVLLGTSGGSILKMDSGSINGNVSGGTNISGLLNNAFDLNGGTINGKLTLGNNGDTVNVNGIILMGDLTGGNGDDILNYGSGKLQGKLQGGTGNNTLNFNASFTTNNTIGKFQTISTLNSGTTLKVTQPITEVDNQLLIGNDTTVQISAANGLTGTGTISNNTNSQLSIDANASVKMSKYTSVASSNLSVALSSPSAFGSLILTGNDPVATFAAGSTITPIITANSVLPNNSTYNIVSASAGIGNANIMDNADAPDNSNSVYSFTRNVVNVDGNSTLQLQLTYSLDTVPGLDGVTQGIAQMLQEYTSNPNNPILNNLIANLGKLSPTEIQKAYRTLVPSYTYGLIASSQSLIHSTFENVVTRLDDGGAPGGSIAQVDNANGMNAGDILFGPYGNFWIEGFGQTQHQRARRGIEGYRSKGLSGLAGIDWNCPEHFTLGFGGGYSDMHTRDRTFNANHYHNHSYEGFIYGSFDNPDSYYVNAIGLIAKHRFRTDRHIVVGTLIDTHSQGRFDGFQFGGQIDLGREFVNSRNDSKFLIVPLARVRYTYLQVDDVIEDGEFGLTIHHGNEKFFSAGIGVKASFETPYRCNILTPQFSAMFMHDLNHHRENTLANFTVAGGGIFSTQGAGISRSSVLLSAGVGLRTSLYNNWNLNYQAEIRDRFLANTVMLGYSYQWQ